MKKRCTIGVIIGNANSPHAMNIIKGVNRAAAEMDVNLMYFVNVRSTYVEQIYHMEDLASAEPELNPIYEYADFAKADVLIMTYGTMSIFLDGENRDSLLERFRDTPCVLLEEKHARPGWSSIIADNYKGMYRIVEHLVKEHGYRELGYLGGPKENTDAREREKAFMDVLQAYGCRVDREHVEYGDFTECVEPQVNRLLDRFPEMEAIVCANDLMALTACRMCEKRGLRVGRDIAVTGYDDWERVRYLDAPMTTVLQDSADMGYLAVKSAIALYNKEPGSALVIPAKIKIRESCGCSCKQSFGADLSEKMTALYLESAEKQSGYIEKTWLVPLISREMVIGVDTPSSFYRSALRAFPTLNVKSSYLFVLKEPIRCEDKMMSALPEKMYLAVSQHGNDIKVYDAENRPEITRENGIYTALSEEERYNLSIFCLISGNTQYGILAAQIQPEDVDIMYLISIQMANALMIYSMEQNRRRANREREALLAELRAKNEVLNFISEYDQMTAVYNRRGLMEGAMQLNQRNLGRKAVFIFADIDHLKEINDCFGHSEGDFAVCKIAEILKNAVRRDDICGRLSGDEFMLMLIGDAKIAKNVIARVHQQCDDYNGHSDKGYCVNVSLGYEEVVCSEELTVAEVLKKADKAMYEEKARRRKSVKKELE